MRRRSLALAPYLAFAAFFAAGPSAAWARNEKLLGYSPSSVWSPLVRFVRVDENLKIVDKDAEAGYLIFELRQDKKVFRGTLEVIAASKDYGARVIIDIADRPSYVELAMLERLERKLIAELGPAPSPPKPPERKPDRPSDRPNDKTNDKPNDKPNDPTQGQIPTQPLPEPGAQR
jgi:hypothetical protein